jgi:exodeoxyribonuclease V alpha subunit
MKDENGDGDTMFPYDDRVEELTHLLGGAEQARTALEQAWKDGRLSWSDAHGGGHQLIAMAAMEEAIAEWVQRGVSHIPRTVNQDFPGLAPDTQQDAQKAAVATILRQRIALVHGSAGTGKTTLLGKLVQAAVHTKRRVFLLALAAKAARRIEESTGHEASTLERFLLSSAKARLRPSDIVVVDEAGMLCAADLYRLVRAAGVCSIALVGDPVQLPPIQSGRPFLDMLLSRSVPTVQLRQVYRQAADNPILDFALAVRDGDVEKAMGLLESASSRLSSEEDSESENGDRSEDGTRRTENRAHLGPAPDASGISLRGVVHIEAKGAAMLPHLALFHDNHSTSSQILAGLKDGPNGVHAINRLLCDRAHAVFRSVGDAGSQGTAELGHTLCGRADLPVGAPVVVTRNLPDHGLDNGTLGTVFDTEWVVFLSGDGSTRAVEATPDMLAALMPAYALTIHKAQGSQWRHVALAVGRSRLLDRSLLYTAATRAVEGLLIVGTKAYIAAAIAAPPRVLGLRTSLRHRIEQTGTTP